MVKKLLSGILKKKEDKGKTEEVPDELPSLGEDTAPKEEAAKQEEVKQATAKKKRRKRQRAPQP